MSLELPAAALDAAGLEAAATLWKRTGRVLAARFRGRSMEPALRDGEEVTLACGESAQPGEVVAYLAGGAVVLHRLVAVSGDWLLLRGDANLLPDAPLLGRGALLGRVTSPLAGPAAPPLAARLLAALFLRSPARAARVLAWLWRGQRRARNLAVALGAQRT